MLLGRKKISFLNLPTPMEYLSGISGELGIKFYLKRDDLTNLGVGGNKLRKLEYLLKDAMDQGATMLMTVGGAQTNHGRLTAAVAAKYGLKCVIACIDNYPGEISANILLDRLMGSEVVLKKDDGRGEDEQLEELTAQLARKYEAQGEKVYRIPMGGSNDLGALGYYECAVETTLQAHGMGLDDARVFVPVGSLGTYMGLCCGLKNEHSPLRCTGVAISPFREAKEKRLMDYFHSVKNTFGLKIDATRADFDVETGYTRGAYNNPSREVREAIYFMARKEGVILDPCYTGKCFAGILDMAREGKIRRGEKIIMVHTGGLPGIYTLHHRVEFEKELRNGVNEI
ncbi:MAG: D-cysteine desulfhydrase family protein [Synergistaceae bacterium]|jgi:D-cysteine desulfhydrase family pyridoxal phosphate-dependent enzyme|nr:D-cysteine desulfhydrase family protein [Synergistaceae bacterium]